MPSPCGARVQWHCDAWKRATTSLLRGSDQIPRQRRAAGDRDLGALAEDVRQVLWRQPVAGTDGTHVRGGEGFPGPDRSHNIERTAKDLIGLGRALAPFPDVAQ